MKKVTYIESRFYDNGKGEARFHKTKPETEANPKYDGYVDTIGAGQSFPSLEAWLDELEGVENLNILLDDLKAGNWIDITAYC